ncbi:hypothetical protein KORDIASMS9_03364 [Kordia sp. SMS9]|uniref:hypothetical protein n=1 Tax=Kordia sp. SMS9 TaxID=2282170 RepID=UPI000E0D85AB|nr:hypothetical protein [Kordia sp. SMS9]AXG71109.1 hypothetical protein KORDIASMS9_03364 [Kordia sp. SMS9]
MIKFFRKIRQNLLLENNFRKYVLYAIGEILLVIIGILIALQINNKNTERIERKIFESNLQYVIEDIKKDKVDLLEIKARRDIVENQIKFILNAITEEKTLAPIEILSNLGIFNWQYYHRNNSGFERILSSNLYESNEFFEVREKIKAYEEINNGYSDTEKRLNEFLEEMEIEMFKKGSNLEYLEYINLWQSVDWKPDAEMKVKIENFKIDFDTFIKNNPPMLSALRRSLVMIPTMITISDMTINSGEEVKQEIENYLKKK